MRLYQINDDDLAELERTLPLLQDCLMPSLAGEAAPRVRKLLGQCKRILSDVRWSYGPPQDVEIHEGGLPNDHD